MLRLYLKLVNRAAIEFACPCSEAQAIAVRVTTAPRPLTLPATATFAWMFLCTTEASNQTARVTNTHEMINSKHQESQQPRRDLGGLLQSQHGRDSGHGDVVRLSGLPPRWEELRHGNDPRFADEPIFLSKWNHFIFDCTPFLTGIQRSVPGRRTPAAPQTP